MKKFLLLWFKAYRAPFLTASIAPVFLGTAVAWYELHQFNVVIFLLALFGTIFAHLGANIFNDYYDHLTGNDDNNPDFTPFSGGSRMIQNGILTPRQVSRAGLIAFVITAVIGIILIGYSGRPALIIFGVIGIILGYIYSAIPVKLAYRGLGELTIFLAFGPVTVLGAYFVQTSHISWLVFLTSIPAGLLVALILYVNELQDENADRCAEKNTLIVNIGNPQKALTLYRIIIFAVLIWILGLTLLSYFPYWTFILIILLPKIIRMIRISTRSFVHIKELLPLSAETISFQFLMTTLLAGAFVFAGFIR